MCMDSQPISLPLLNALIYVLSNALLKVENTTHNLYEIYP